MGKLKHNFDFKFSMLAFIDIVFLILIFIVITFRIEEPRDSITLDVPSVNAPTHNIFKGENELLIQIAKGDTIYYKGEIVDLNILDSIVSNFKGKKSGNVVLECDKNSSINVFSQVISLFATKNITDYSLVVKELQND